MIALPMQMVENRNNDEVQEELPMWMDRIVEIAEEEAKNVEGLEITGLSGYLLSARFRDHDVEFDFEDTEHWTLMVKDTTDDDYFAMCRLQNALIGFGTAVFQEVGEIKESTKLRLYKG